MEMFLVKNQSSIEKTSEEIEILVKNGNFGQKSKFSSKIEILIKNQNFGQKSNFWPNILKFTFSYDPGPLHTTKLFKLYLGR